jgi:hypothetical protein
MVNLLLIDSTVAGYDQLITATNTDTKYIVFDRSTDTFLTVIKKISALPLTSLSNIGIVQHGTDGDVDYQMLDSEPACKVVDVEQVDPMLASWGKFITFITFLKNKYNIQNLDFISCLLYNNPNWVYIIKTLETKLGVNFRASKDNTGNLAQGANWMMESDNINIAPLYFTSEINNFTTILYLTIQKYTNTNRIISKDFTRKSPAVNGTTVKTNNMYTFPTPQRLIKSWGSYGGTAIDPSDSIVNIRSVATTATAFAAITTSDKVLTWGNAASATLPGEITNVDVITATEGTFCALKKDGSLVAWGAPVSDTLSGSIPSSISDVSDYVGIISTNRAFAAIRNNRILVAWGDPTTGGFTPSFITDVSAVDAFLGGFVILKTNGTVICLNNSTTGIETFPTLIKIVNVYGGSANEFLCVDSSGMGYHISQPPRAVTPLQNTSPIVSVYLRPTSNMVCLCEDNTVILAPPTSTLLSPLQLSDMTNVKRIAGMGNSTCLVKYDGSVICSNPTSSVTIPGNLTNIKSIAAANNALTALRNDNTIISWGSASLGGTTPASSTNIDSVYGLQSAFVALKTDGTMIGWGSASAGATIPADVSGVSYVIPATSSVSVFRNMPTSVSIRTHPVSQTISEGSPVSFTVDLSGATTPTYQWKKDGVNISGATSATLSIASVQQSNAGSYTVVITDGSTTLTSNAAILTVTTSSPPTISSQPISLTVLDGSSATFSVVASGTGLTYQWRLNGVNITGATSASYTIAEVRLGSVGSYTVVVSNSAGSITSNVATLAIGVVPAITVQPSSRIVLAGTSATFSVIATGSGLSYQWKKGGVAISGATSSSYVIQNVQLANVGAYSVVVSNTFGSVESNIVSLAIGSAPQITTQPAEFPEVSGGAVSISIDVSGTGPFTYQWLRDNRPIAGATNASYSITGVNSTHAGLYRVRVSNTLGNAISQEANLTAPRIQQQPSGTIVNNSTTLTVSATGNPTLTYQWRKDGAMIGGATSSSYTISDVAANGGSYTVVVSNAFGSRTSVPVALATAPVIIRQPEARSVLAGATVRFGVLVSGQDLSYQWMKGGVNISNATSATYDIGSAASADEGIYSVKITNTIGNTTSTGAQLTVITAAEPTKAVLKKQFLQPLKSLFL